MHNFDLPPRAFTRMVMDTQITPERELELARDYYGKGDVKARDDLLEGTRWVPASRALEYCRVYKVMDQFYDLFAEGQLGMLKALDKYDVTRDIRFSTFAYSYVEFGIRRYVRDRVGSLVRQPERERDEDGQRHYTKFSVARDMSLDAPLSKANDQETQEGAYAFFPDMRFNPERQASRKQLEARLDRAFTCLSYRERKVVHEHLLGDRLLKDMAVEMGGVSHQRVQQIGQQAIKKLRKAMLDNNPASRYNRLAVKTPVTLPSAPATWHPSAVETGEEPRLIDNKLFQLLVLTGSVPDLVKPLPGKAPQAG